MFKLNYRDSQPIYGQIKDGLRRMIVTGALEPGEKLPSVRAMAMDLAINPNTIHRAYSELEAEGFIYSIPGKGSFAAQRKPADAAPAGSIHGADPGREARLIRQLRELVAELRYLNYTDSEIIALMQEGVGQ
ncbi:MAG: GntR family transcriptional regulator [Oscillospiraceae bacterium]|nr:GntR family transcriptional regulator [Oscillospiraceae bacterium]